MKYDDIYLRVFVCLLIFISSAFILFVAYAGAEDCDPCTLECFDVSKCEQFQVTPGCFVPGAECNDDRVFIDCEFDRETLNALYGRHVGFLCDDANELFETEVRLRNRIRKVRNRLRACRRGR